MRRGWGRRGGWGRGVLISIAYWLFDTFFINRIFIDVFAVVWTWCNACTCNVLIFFSFSAKIRNDSVARLDQNRLHPYDNSK